MSMEQSVYLKRRDCIGKKHEIVVFLKLDLRVNTNHWFILQII